MTDDSQRTAGERIVWVRLDIPGHESCEQIRTADGWQLRGVAVLAYENQPCRLEYDIHCDGQWLTDVTAITGHVGANTIDLELRRNPAGEWTSNGSKVWELTGCDDVDLNFSPSTNMLPVRRMNLAVGGSAQVRAAWVRFPSFSIEPFEQTYTRLGPETYRYESADGKFSRDLTVDEAGFVLDYPGIWRAEARS
ncbi:MAG: putative glycolipid-binding domain-containing protein [Gemmatimonadaceae bacterium]